MPRNRDREFGHLPRLDDVHYRGFAFVHWTMTIRNRQRGWLSDQFHQRFRELLLHSCSRYHSICPVYCLMPDHFHLLLLGIADESDQFKLTKHFRRHVNTALEGCSPNPDQPFRLQKQAYDSVLREADRARDAFQSVAFYIAENPVRASLTEDPSTWPFCDAVIPGYPELTFSADDYWDRFWRLYYSRLPEGLFPAIDRRNRK